MTTPTHSSSSPHHLPEPTPPLSRKSSAPLSAIQSPGNRHPALRRLQSCRAHSTANRCLSQQRYPSQTPRRARLASHTPQPVCMSLSMPARPLEHMRLSLMAAPWLSNRAVAGFPQGGPPGSGDDVPYHLTHQGRSRPSVGAPSIIRAIIEGHLLIGVLPDSIFGYPPPDRYSLRGPCDTGRFGQSSTPIHTKPLYTGYRTVFWKQGQWYASLPPPCATSCVERKIHHGEHRRPCCGPPPQPKAFSPRLRYAGTGT
jgi:hypothetical protein